MTKTPDEIKRGLACCAASIYQCADDCPYRAECRNGQGGKAVMEDALALIQQLQKDKADLLEERELNDYLRDRVKQLEAERDAAVEDLKYFSDCRQCNSWKTEENCRKCRPGKNWWQWRGVQKEE